MPLGPKQQAPYYIPEAMPTPSSMNKFLRLNTQYTDLVTSGTSETDLYSYTIPANTLVENGDTLLIKYSATGTGANALDDRLTRLYIGSYLGGVVGTGGNPGTPFTWTVEVVKISSSQAKITMFVSNTIDGEVTIQQTQPSFDFTGTITMKFTGQCSGTATIQTYSLLIDKISI